MKKIYFLLMLCCIAFSSIAQTTTYSTPGAYTYTVPASVTIVSVDVAGAQGGYGSAGGGKGGRVQATIAVSGGDVLYIYVGGVGATSVTAGYNGGGSGGASSGPFGGGGGGGSDIRVGGITLSNRLIVAGGGGGGGNLGAAGGGAGGGTTGSAGGASGSATGGGGGTPSTGGAGGIGASATGAAGALGVGGNGVGGNPGTGGGGGGYYGGGGGGRGTTHNTSGGGGGSSYYGGTGVTFISTTPGYETGNGYVIITPGPAGPTFDGGNAQSTAVCENSGATSINSLLTASEGTGLTFTWSVSSGPANGTLGGFNATASSGTSITPSGLTYTPNTNYSGTDAFTIQVSDGTNAATTTVSVNVNPAPNVASLGTGGSYSATGIGTLVSVTSGTLATATYTVTYNLGGANTATGNTASMAFSSGTGTFTTSAPISTGITTVTITNIDYSPSAGCPVSVTSGNSAAYTVNSAPAGAAGPCVCH